MRRRGMLVLLLVSLALGFWPGVGAQERGAFRVIVHADNAAAELSRTTAGNFFLKKQGRWTDDNRVEPIDLEPDSPTREAFSRSVLRRDVRSVLRYWQRQIFSGFDVPPPEVASDAEVIAFVASHRGAIGYVSSNARLEGVRELRITDSGDGP